MSFELKPAPQDVGAKDLCSICGTLCCVCCGRAPDRVDPRQIVWTCARNPAPVLLAGRVPDDVWASTFDAVYARCAEETESARKIYDASIGGLPLIPCCVPCILAKHSMSGHEEESMRQQQAWLKLVQDEQQKYAPYGVQITVAQEERSHYSAGGHRLDEMNDHGEFVTIMVNVGLKFDMAAAVVVAEEMIRDVAA